MVASMTSGQTKTMLLLLVLGTGVAACTVNHTGIAGPGAATGSVGGATSAGGRTGAGGHAGNVGSGTGGGAGGDTGGAAGGDARDSDTSPSSGGGTGSGGGIADAVPASGGASGLGGSTGPGGTGAGGLSMPTGGATGVAGSGGTTVDGPSNEDLGRDTADGVRRDTAREAPVDLGVDSPIGNDDAPGVDAPTAQPDGRDAIDASPDVSTIDGPSLTLVWSDEFDGDANTGVDPGKWSYATWAPGHINNELQQYTSGTTNVFLDGAGNLVIRARYAPAAANPYTSGRLETSGKVTFGPGHRIEVRAKLPAGIGSFPAIIMLGASGTWPDSGELALMEQWGQDKSWFYATAYAGTAAGSGKTPSTKYTFPDATTASADYHVYALDWYADHLVFQVDGNVIVSSTYNTSSPFYNITEYLVLDVAVGGDMGGTVDNGAFPMDMVVDYVRVYAF